MAIKSEKLLLPHPTSGPCPTCGYQQMNVQAKDQNSVSFDWVTCANPTPCAYAASVADFRNAKNA